MSTTYVKRLRMEIDLRRSDLPEPSLPAGYEWRAWHPMLTEAHARAKWAAFQGQIDAQLFPCLATLPGCRRLVSDISLRRGFLPAATWLIVLPATPFRGITPCATIQGVVQRWRTGAIQNVGVVPEHRGLGIGRALVLQSLHGFRQRGLKKVILEVTAENTPAIELYSQVGFRHTRTSYRAIDVPEQQTAPLP